MNMDGVKEWARKGWTWFRARVWWQQLIGWVLVVSVIVGPFTDRKKQDDEKQSRPATTEQSVPETVAVTDPPTTSPAPSTVAESVPPQTVPPQTEPAQTAAPVTEAPTTTAPPATTTTTTVPETTTTVSEHDRIAASVSDELQGADLVSVDAPDALASPDQVAVTLAGSQGLTDGLTKDAARLAVFSTLRGLEAAALDPAVTRFRIVVMYDLVDQFGAVTNDPVVVVVYDRQIADKIQFDNISFKTVLTLPTLDLYIHPSFAKGDGS